MDANERARRYRARKRGEDVPKLEPGPKPGFKQSAEHVSKRARWAEQHHAWKGDGVTKKGGRSRALRQYKGIGPCVFCGNPKTERHHIDENTANNKPSNILAVCRKCHVLIHRIIKAARRADPAAGNQALL